MAKKVQVLLVDDIDKSSPADETVSFSLDGVSYEIDLTSGNAAKLRDDLAVWIGHAERTGGRRSTGPRGIQGLRSQGRPRRGARLGPRQRPQGQRPRPHLRRGPGRLRQGPRLSLEPHTDAAPPDLAGAASSMSRRHAWLVFTAGGPALSRTLADRPRRVAAPAHRPAGPLVRRRRTASGRRGVRAAVAAPGARPHGRPRGGSRSVAGRPHRAHLRPRPRPGALGGAPHRTAAGCRPARRADGVGRARLPRGRRARGDRLPVRGAAGAAHPRGTRRRHVVGRPPGGRGRRRAVPAGRPTAGVVLPDLRPARAASSAPGARACASTERATGQTRPPAAVRPSGR